MNKGCPVVELSLDRKHYSGFIRFLRAGVGLGITPGSSIRSLLCDQVGLPGDYVQDRITTIFLNGQPVDDLDKAVLHDGSVLALSAAMPGLVGATMRRGGYYAGLRSAISYRGDTGCDRETSGFITIKLFNMVADEAGAIFLEKGIYLDREILLQVIEEIKRDFNLDEVNVRLDGKPADASSLHDLLPEKTEILLRITPLNTGQS